MTENTAFHKIHKLQDNINGNLQNDQHIFNSAIIHKQQSQSYDIQN